MGGARSSYKLYTRSSFAIAVFRAKDFSSLSRHASASRERDLPLLQPPLHPDETSFLDPSPILDSGSITTLFALRGAATLPFSPPEFRIRRANIFFALNGGNNKKWNGRIR